VGFESSRCGCNEVWGQLMRPIQQIEALLEELNPDELLALIEHIARRLRLPEERKPQPLYGIWQGKFPQDADIDTTLKEVRHQWQEDLKEFGE
jgi:hypothetical protein